MKDDRLHDDDLALANAFRAVRETYDGAHEAPNLTLQRALFRTRTRERKRRVVRWVVLPAAAALVASTAWAGVTGRLAPAVSSILESLHAERPSPAPVGSGTPVTQSAAAANSAVATKDDDAPPPAESPGTPSSEPPAAPAAPPTEPPTGSVPAEHVVAPSQPREPSGRDSATPSTTSPSVSNTAHGTASGDVATASPAPVSSATPDPNAALFAEAHRLHFVDRDPVRALAAWDRYLAAAPSGRFVPEARYNRALALIRAGRELEAKRELEAFANGTYGGYRRDEARALLDAIDGDASRP